MTDTRSIYVACLAAYNAGHLHGAWIEIDPDPAVMHDEIQAMLRESPCALDHVMPSADLRARQPHGGNAVAIARLQARRRGEYTTEEWAIHDPGSLPLGEYASLDEVAALAQLFEDADDEALAEAVLAYYGDVEAAREALDRYLGSGETAADWASEYLADELSAIPEHLRAYFDFDAWIRDFECGGGVLIRTGEMVYAFDCY